MTNITQFHSPIREKKEILLTVNRAPQVCGCYLWKDKHDKILYVGKAQNLKIRLQSYARNIPENVRIVTMLTQVEGLEWIITQTEKEALLLEANLIKKNKPRFNVRLKDDKRYPYLCISITEEYPQIYLSHRRKEDQNLYFGPYTDVKATRKTLELIHKIFPIRKVRQKLPLKRIRRPCVNFDMKRCLAPCQNNIDKNEYKKITDEIVLFLEGKTEILENLLQERMSSYSNSQEFEKAAIYRDMIRSIRRVVENQVVQSNTGEEDILAIARQSQEEDYGQIVILEIRQGRLISRKSFPLQEIAGASDYEIIEAFIRDYYLSLRNVPKRIQIPFPLKQKKIIEDVLKEKLEYRVNFFVGHQEKSKALYSIAKRNAELLLTDRLLSIKSATGKKGLGEIRDMLGLPKLPRVMECYDISHIQGFETVASGIVFIEGKAHKSSYRHYRVKKIVGIDDPASLKEILDRRLRRLIKEGQSFPDLFLIDGGITQVNSAYQAAQDLGLGYLSFVGIAKKKEEIYFPQKNIPHNFTLYSAGMKLLCRMRDEAHRSAIQYHRKRRNAQALRHFSEKMKNLGKKRSQALLEHLSQTFQPIEKVGIKELTQVPGIGPQLAEKICDFFNESKK